MWKPFAIIYSLLVLDVIGFDAFDYMREKQLARRRNNIVDFYVNNVGSLTGPLVELYDGSFAVAASGTKQSDVDMIWLDPNKTLSTAAADGTPFIVKIPLDKPQLPEKEQENAIKLSQLRFTSGERMGPKVCKLSHHTREMTKEENAVFCQEKVDGVMMEELLSMMKGDHMEPQFWKLVGLLFRGVRELWQAGVSHCDLHLGNIMVETRQDRPSDLSGHHRDSLIIDIDDGKGNRFIVDMKPFPIRFIDAAFVEFSRRGECPRSTPDIYKLWVEFSQAVRGSSHGDKLRDFIKNSKETSKDLASCDTEASSPSASSHVSKHSFIPQCPLSTQIRIAQKIEKHIKNIMRRASQVSS